MPAAMLRTPLVEGDFKRGRFRRPLGWGDYWPKRENDNQGVVVFRGTPTVADIDYSKPVASREGTGDVEITHLTHTVSTVYFYAARQVSKFGRVEKNRTRVSRLEIKADGTHRTTMPDHVSNVQAVAAAGGTIKVHWDHTRFNGSAPVKFNVYYDKGLGIGALDVTEATCLLGSVTYRGSTTYTYTTGAMVDGTTYLFVVQAEDADGNEDDYVAVVEAAADATAPDPLSSVTVESIL